MKETRDRSPNYYSPVEERINIVSHAIGLVLSIFALVILVIHAATKGDIIHITSFSIFGCSLILLYTASTVYHRAAKEDLRNKLRVFDHAAIYVLIAGTYTPFVLITLSGFTGWLIFGIVWTIAISGIILKIFFTGRLIILSTLIYIAMGWLIIFFIEPLVNNLSSNGLIWLLAGGLLYTIGAILYAIKKIKFNHAIFHIFVLAGSFSHFVSIYFYVLPH